MTIQDWGAVGEIIGAIAVLVTLIYLSLQIRMSAKTQRAQTNQQLADGRREGLRMMFEYPSIRESTRKAVTGEELSEDERQDLYWFTVMQIRGYENELYQYEMGMVDADELDVQRKLLLLPHFQIERVAQVKNLFTPRMQIELEKLITERSART